MFSWQKVLVEYFFRISTSMVSQWTKAVLKEETLKSPFQAAEGQKFVSSRDPYDDHDYSLHGDFVSAASQRFCEEKRCEELVETKN